MYPTIFFHDLEANAVTWEIFGGEIFIDAVPNENPDKPFDVFYLTNEMWYDGDMLNEYNNSFREEQNEIRYEENDFLINVVKFEGSPKNLEDRKLKAPLVQTRKQFKVAFGTAKGFEIA